MTALRAKYRILLTQHGSQCNQPSANVGEGLDDLFLFQLLIRSTALVVPNAFERRDSLFFRQETCMDGGVREPQNDAHADQDSQSTEEDINDLVRRENTAVAERDTVRNEPAEYLRETWAPPSINIDETARGVSIPFCGHGKMSDMVRRQIPEDLPSRKTMISSLPMSTISHAVITLRFLELTCSSFL